MRERQFETGECVFGVSFGFTDMVLGLQLYLTKNFQIITIGFGPLQFYVVRG